MHRFELLFLPVPLFPIRFYPKCREIICRLLSPYARNLNFYLANRHTYILTLRTYVYIQSRFRTLPPPAHAPNSAVQAKKTMNIIYPKKKRPFLHFVIRCCIMKGQNVQQTIPGYRQTYTAAVER